METNLSKIACLLYHSHELLPINVAIFVLVSLGQDPRALLPLLPQLLCHPHEISNADTPLSQLVEIIKGSPQLFLLISVVLSIF